MKVHIVSYNLGQNFFSKSKIHILTISGPMSIKPAIVRPLGHLADVGAPEPGDFGVGSLAGERAAAPELDGEHEARGSKDRGGGHLVAPKPDVLGVSSLAGARETAGRGSGPPELDGRRGPEDGGGGRLGGGASDPGV